jgi:hypothetical protein
MKGATECARRLKSLVRSLRAKLGKGGRRTSGDAVTQMILGILSRDVPESKARAALDRLRSTVVDYNELRVVPAIELAELLEALPDSRLKSEDLSRSLNSLFMYEHDVSFERLASASRKEIVAFLEGIDGLDAYTHARIRLYGFNLHAVPLDCAMWAYARKMEIVDRKCSLEEAQAFLERRLSEKEAPAVVALLEQQAWAEMGAAVRSGKVEPICSVPPDRTSRNMLQMVASGQETTVIEAADEEAVDEAPAEKVGDGRAEKPAGGKSPKKRKSAGGKKAAAKKPGGKSKRAAAAKKSGASARKTKKRAKKSTKRASRAKRGAKKTQKSAKKTARRKTSGPARRSGVKAKSA